MKPTSKREEEMVERVDKKARAIEDGASAWDNRVVTEMKIAVGFQMSVAEEQFLESYVAWRRQKSDREIAHGGKPPRGPEAIVGKHNPCSPIVCRATNMFSEHQERV
jgi:hypothetical protein